MKDLKQYTIGGILFVFLAGTIAHFIYDLSGNNHLVGYFFSVNESTWEHMKLSFYPFLIYSIFMNQKLKKIYPCITSALSLGILITTVFIPILFYTYSGILGYNIQIVNILTFYISVLLGFYFSYRNTLSCKAQSYQSTLYFCIICFILGFFLFTYHPPKLGIFADPTLENAQMLQQNF